MGAAIWLGSIQIEEAIVFFDLRAGQSAVRAIVIASEGSRRRVFNLHLEPIRDENGRVEDIPSIDGTDMRFSPADLANVISDRF